MKTSHTRMTVLQEDIFFICTDPSKQETQHGATWGGTSVSKGGRRSEGKMGEAFPVVSMGKNGPGKVGRGKSG